MGRAGQGRPIRHYWEEKEPPVFERDSKTRDCIERRTASLQGYGSTEDGQIRATVDNTGKLILLELAPGIMPTCERDFAHRIMDAIQQAVLDVREQIQAVYVGLRNEGTIQALPPSLPRAPAVNQVTLDILRRTKPESSHR
jgi:hypothetical protein